jgi:hypothetical protein
MAMRTLARSSSLVAAGVLAACTAVQAQVTPVVPAPAEPSPAASQTVQPTPAPAPAPAERASRQDIRSMEVLLTDALQRGAQALARQLKVNQPNSAFVTGTGRARGFILDGHGLFFDVDVPEMRQSMVWTAQMLELDQQRRDLLQFLASTPANDPRRGLAEANLRQIARQMGAGQGEIVIPSPTENTQMARPGKVIANDVSPVSDSPMPPGGRALASPFMQQVPPLADANELYTDAVKAALIDVMLKFSGHLKIRDNEWLTVAASDSEVPQTPGAVQETARILISIKGIDLAAFHGGKLTREEVLKKVAVKEF